MTTTTNHLSPTRAQGVKQVAVRLWNHYMPSFLQIKESIDAHLHSDLVAVDGWDISHRGSGAALLVGLVGYSAFGRRRDVGKRLDGRTLPDDDGPGLREAWWMLSDALGDGWAWLRNECKELPELLLELAWSVLIVAMCLLLVLMVAMLMWYLRGA